MKNSNLRILLVEDDSNLGFVIKDNLEASGFEVDWCEDGERALGKFGVNKFDLCLVDVMLPKLDGFSLVKKIREMNEQVPVLFLTAKSLEEDKIKGFQLGADDYITKPFSMEELILRIKVFLKRNLVNYHLPKSGGSISVGKYIFDRQNLSLCIESETTKLTEKEADLLEFFTQNDGIVVKREHILKAVWGQSDYFLGRSLDVFITRLRKYLKADQNISITNHHRVGFQFSTDRNTNEN